MASRLKQTALVLDDEAPIRELLALSLVKLGWECETAAGWDEARERLQSKCFDVLVIDYHMPEGNGHHFVCTLRQQGITLPAILISGDEAIHRLTPRALLTIPAVLRKPINFDDLEAALKMVSS